MKIIVWLMITGFAVVGLWCVREGLFSFLKTLRRRPYLLSAQGTVLTVEKTRDIHQTISDGRSRSQIVLKFMPVIQFMTEEGDTVVFRSETGEVYSVSKSLNGRTIEPTSRYKAGQRVPLLYDPKGELKPCQDDWASLYGMSTAMIVAGTLFVTVAAGMILLYRDKLMF